jgi:hypothetical protein
MMGGAIACLKVSNINCCFSRWGLSPKALRKSEAYFFSRSAKLPER